MDPSHSQDQDGGVLRVSETCDSCGQVVSKAVTNAEIFAALKKFKSPWQWQSVYGQPAVDVPNVGKVEVVEVSDNYDDDPGYGELNIYLVWCVDGNKFYKVEGEKSSYDGTVWDSYISRVTKQKKEVWVYQ